MPGLVRCWLIGFVVLVSAHVAVWASSDDDWSLGPVGGTFRTNPGSNLLTVRTCPTGTPAAVGGLRVGDWIYGAFIRASIESAQP